MQPGLQQIHQKLRHVRWLLRFCIARIALLWFLGLWVLSATALVYAHAYSMLSTNVIFWLTCYGMFLLLLWRRTQPLQSIATYIEQHHATLGSAITSAICFNTTQTPSALMLAHQDHTCITLDSMDFTPSIKQRYKALLQVAQLTCIAACMLMLISIVLSANVRSQWLAWLKHDYPTLISETLLVGNIRLLYHYPSYSKLPDRIVNGSDGSISALIGTEVHIEGSCKAGAKQALMHTDSNQQLALQISNNKNLTGHLTIVHNDAYRFALQYRNKTWLQERAAHSIEAIPDAMPTISLDTPENDTLLHDNDALYLHWHGQDDYGIVSVTLVTEHEQTGRITRTPLPCEPQTTTSGSYTLQAANMQLMPGDSLRLYLEITDNDTILGPKHSTSTTRRITRFSAAEHREQLLAQERAFFDALVIFLGQQIISNQLVATNNISNQLQNLVQLLQNNNNPHTAAFINIQAHINTATRSQRIIHIERDIIYLDDLLAISHIENIKESAQTLTSMHQNLKSMLQQYPDSKDPMLEKILIERMQTLRQNMQRLLEAMARTKQSLPDEYRNIEANQMQDINDKLDRFEKSLQDGDMQSAIEQLEALEDSMHQMQNNLSDAQQNYGTKRYQGIQKNLEDFATSFDALKKQQKKLAEQTSAWVAQYNQAIFKKTAGNMNDFIKQAQAIQQSAQTAAKQLSHDKQIPLFFSEAMRSIEKNLSDIDIALTHHDLFEAHNQAATLQQNSADFAMQLQETNSQEISKKLATQSQMLLTLLEKLFPKTESIMNQQTLQNIQTNANMQQQLAQQAGALTDKMQHIAEEIPIFGADNKQLMQEAQAAMQTAFEQLHNNALRQGSHAQQEASARLEHIQKTLEQAAQASDGRGIPMPIMKGLRTAEASTGRHQETVNIPKDDHNIKRLRFREDVRNAAKQQAPQHFEDAVRHYYHELIQ